MASAQGRNDILQHAQGGFTLVENVVSLIVVGIVIVAIAAVLMFSSTMVAHQQAVSNAQTLASTVKTSVEGTLRSAENIEPNPQNGTITFKTKHATAYLGSKGKTFTLSIQDGHVHIESASGDGGELLPADTYIDDETVEWSVAGDGQISLTVYSSTHENLANTTIAVDSGASSS